VLTRCCAPIEPSGSGSGPTGADRRAWRRWYPEGSPDDLRVFVAVPLAEAARTAVQALVEEVVGDPALPEAGRLRWALTENLHLTVRFIGATAPDRVPDLVMATEAAAALVAPFTVRLSGAGAFPAADRPRILWLGIVEGAAELGALAGTLGEQLAEWGWDHDERPFRAHLTLGRADGVRGAGRAVAALARAATALDAAWTVDRLVVYQSDLGHGPVRYRPLVTALLRSDP
jgi:2'-5' RNA ligase